MISVPYVIFALIAGAAAQQSHVCGNGKCTGTQDAEDAVIMLQNSIKQDTTLSDSSEEPFHGLKAWMHWQSKDLNVKAVFAEYIAMTLFVVIGCGSAMVVAEEPGSAKPTGWVLQVALSFGFAISSLAYAVGHYSGAQINCAVTFGLLLSGQLALVQAFINFIAQMLGSITGAFLLTCICPQEKDKTNGIGSNGISKGYSVVNALVGECAMTFLLMFVVMETAVNPANKGSSLMACLAIGLAVFLAHSVLIPIDGCSINPTRSFGPALITKTFYKEPPDTFQHMWVFWVGPLSGAAGATIVQFLLAAA